MTVTIRIEHRGGNKKVGIVVKDNGAETPTQTAILFEKGDEFNTYVFNGNTVTIGELEDAQVVEVGSDKGS